MQPKSRHLKRPKIDPKRITAGMSLVGPRRRHVPRLQRRAAARGVPALRAQDARPTTSRIGMSLTGALTPAGLGMSALIPLIEAGFVDWIVSTGANLYHDTHFGIGLEHAPRARRDLDDVVLREEGVVRIYDIFFDYNVLLETDAFFREDHRRARVPARDGHGGVPLPASASTCASGEQALGLKRRSLLVGGATSAACRSTPRRPATARSA